MAFPTLPIPTTNLDAGTDSPASARADLLLLAQHMNTIIDEAGDPNGVCVLNNSGQVPATNLPAVIAPTNGVLTLAPASGRIKIEDVLRLEILSTTSVQALSDIAEGDIVYCSDGNGGSPCLAVYNGTNWLRIALGVAISST